jgi:hypothetical protein
MGPSSVAEYCLTAKCCREGNQHHHKVLPPILLALDVEDIQVYPRAQPRFEHGGAVKLAKVATLVSNLSFKYATAILLSLPLL